MSEPNLFVLVCIRDNALMWHWTISATDELDVARQIRRNPWSYENVYWALGVHMSKTKELDAEELLKAIQDSYMNMNSLPAVLHLMPVERVQTPAATTTENVVLA